MTTELHALRILLTEDDPSIAKLFKVLLSVKGCEVVTAVNGREALEKWAENSFDLILMDLNMPGMDGFQVARAIRDREDPSLPRTPIVAMTAHIAEGDQRCCREAGMDGCLSKHGSIDDLYNIIRGYLPK